MIMSSIEGIESLTYSGLNGISRLKRSSPGKTIMAMQKRQKERKSESKIPLGISSCLLGEHVRYDGGHKLDHYLRDTLGQFVKWVPVCPEVECGLSVPREAMHLVGDPASPRLVTRFTGIDHTERMKRWAGNKLSELEKEGLCGFVFKARSPSSGMERVKVYSASGTSFKMGSGLFAKAFKEHFPLIPAEDEGRLQDPDLRENFFERVFIYYRWQQLLDQGGKIRDLVAFHTSHKYLLMSHSSRLLKELGALVANPKQYEHPELLARYFMTLMHGLCLMATKTKHSNVLQHLAGYFKKQLSPSEKQELLGVIGQYHSGLVPLIVPLTLIRHYVRKYDEAYLKGQYYLEPHPLELMLRNHV
jgi:uncharacterized protein YbgA (DUF1722 family)/uncharacterized protein YbbK (DUF523 family)